MRAWIRPLLLALTLGFVAAPIAMAQQDQSGDAAAEDPADERATSFQAVEGPVTEDVPGGALMVVAYAAVWILVSGTSGASGASPPARRPMSVASSGASPTRLPRTAAARADLPSIEHIIYIPGILLLGLALGFRLGARAARAELERQQKARRE